jgi:hypothetical protein
MSSCRQAEYWTNETCIYIYIYICICICNLSLAPLSRCRKGRNWIRDWVGVRAEEEQKVSALLRRVTKDLIHYNQ